MFAYTQDNGVVAICSTQRGVPEGTPFEEVDASTFPQDREYRDAWVLQGSSVIEHPGKKAQLLHKKEKDWATEEFSKIRDVSEALEDNGAGIPGNITLWKKYRKDVRAYAKNPEGDRPTPPQ